MESEIDCSFLSFISFFFSPLSCNMGTRGHSLKLKGSSFRTDKKKPFFLLKILHVVYPWNLLSLSLGSWRQRLWLDFKEAGLISQPFTTFVATWGKAKKAWELNHMLWGKTSVLLSQDGNIPIRAWRVAGVGLSMPTPVYHSSARSFCLTVEVDEGMTSLSPASLIPAMVS